MLKSSGAPQSASCRIGASPPAWGRWQERRTPGPPSRQIDLFLLYVSVYRYVLRTNHVPVTIHHARYWTHKREQTGTLS